MLLPQILIIVLAACVCGGACLGAIANVVDFFWNGPVHWAWYERVLEGVLRGWLGGFFLGGILAVMTMPLVVVGYGIRRVYNSFTVPAITSSPR